MPRSEFRDVVANGPGGDLARMLGIADRFPKSDLTLVPRDWLALQAYGRTLRSPRTAPPGLTMATDAPMQSSLASCSSATHSRPADSFPGRAFSTDGVRLGSQT